MARLKTWAEDFGALRRAGKWCALRNLPSPLETLPGRSQLRPSHRNGMGEETREHFERQRARKARLRATSRSPGRPSRPPSLARPPAGPGFEPAGPGAGAGSSAAVGVRGPGAGGRGQARLPARGVPGGRGAPAAPPAPRGDPGPPPAGPRWDAPARPERAGRRAGRGRAGDETKAPLLSGGCRRVTHNGGSRLRRRRARRGALPRRPAGAPRTRTHTHSRDFSDSSRECGARGQPPVSAQVSGCAGGSGVSEALALPQSPPCNPDPRERARERGRGLPEPRPRTSQAHSTGSPAPARPRELARGGISNARDSAPRVAGVAGEARGLVSRLGGLGRGAGGEVGRRALSAPLPSPPLTK